MSFRIPIRGLTWDHPRAYEGLDAETALFNDEQERINLTWDRHSLREFEEASITESARRYDLIILDHPFMGDVVSEECLVDLGQVMPLRTILSPKNFVGPSLESYRYGGGLWAMPIDAACQTAAWRPDLIEHPPTTLDALRRLLGRSQISLAMACPHAFMNFLCIAGMSGTEIDGSHEALMPREKAVVALELLREIASAIPDAAYGWSSIGALDALAASDRLAFCPMVFCFSTYARDARAGTRLRFSAPPLTDRGGFSGSVAGGAGLAVSKSCPHLDAALTVVAFMADAASQLRCSLAGGQPARAETWRDAVANERNGGFFEDCRLTMERAQLRPRYAGYMELQNAAGHILADACRDRSVAAEDVIERIDSLYRITRRRVSASVGSSST